MKSLFEHIDNLTSFTSLNEAGVDLGVNASVDLPDELVNTAAMALLADDDTADYKYTYDINEIRSELEKAYAVTSGYSADSADDVEYQESLDEMLSGVEKVESTTPLTMISQMGSDDYPGFKGGSVKTYLKDGRVFVWTEGDEDELPLVTAVELVLSNEIKESEDNELDYNELSDTQIIDDIINSYDAITGQDIRTIFNYENTGNDSDGYFKQEEVDKTSNKIIDWLSKQGLSRSRIDDLLYKLDDKLASVWSDYAPTNVNEAEGKPLDKEKYSTLMNAIEDIVYDIGDNNQQKKDLLNDIVNEFKRCAEASGYPLTENEELKESEIMNDTNVVDICNSFSSRTNKNYKIEGDEAIFEDGTIIKFVLNDDNQIEYYFINTQGDASKTALVTDFSLLDLVTESAELKESEDPSMNLMNQLKEVVKGTQGVENVSEVSYEPYALMSYSLRFEQDGVTYILGLTEDESEE